MAPGISHSRFTHPIDSERPKGASRFEFLAPKLKRRVTLFDPFHVRLWALLESNPRVLRYCERPAYWHHDNRRQLADFWVKIGRREVCWIVTPTPQLARAGGPECRRRYRRPLCARPRSCRPWRLNRELAAHPALSCVE